MINASTQPIKILKSHLALKPFRNRAMQKTILFLFTILLGGCVISMAQTKPNILVIVLDDARFDMFAPNGGPSFFSSPAINRIADEGINFKFSGATTSLCCPSRASIYTGLYAHHHGTFEETLSPKPGLTYVSQVLKDAGYYTGFIGKWLYNWKLPDTPVGFNYWAVTDSFNHLTPLVRFNDGTSQMYSENDPVVFTDLAVDFLDNKVPAQQPWLLFLCHRVPHTPYQPIQSDNLLYQDSVMPFPDNFYPYQKDFPNYLYPGHLYEGDSAALVQDMKDYYETCQGAEYSTDSMLKYLEGKNLLDSTLIIFMSDNGFMLGEHYLTKKILAQDESLRIPIFVRYPAWFTAGTVVNDEFGSNLDIAPTILDAAGIPDTFHMDGVSLRKLADGELQRKYFFYENYQSVGNWWDAVRSFDYMYIYSYCDSLVEEFYDLTNDPKENTNVIFDTAYSALIQEYRDRIDSFRLVTGDTVIPIYGNCRYEFTSYADADNDGYGNADVNVQDDVLPAGYVLNKDDCNDANGSIHPNAVEICNGIDENCNGVIDEGALLTFYADADGDGFGTALDTIQGCTLPVGYSLNNTDCNDGDLNIHPGAAETCNGIDDNCNGTPDDGLSFTTYYADADGDTYGDAFSTGDSMCSNPGAGYSTNNSDCNDANASINPAAIEICNNLDDDCNGTADDGLTFVQYYADVDGDSYGNASNFVDACAQPGGYVGDSTDCDDSNASIHPGATEIQNNGIDDNCNGYIDEFGVGIPLSYNSASALLVFPNPTNGQFVVYLQLNNEENFEAAIEVINTLGQTVIVKTGELSKGKLLEEIKFSKGAAEGMYFVKVIVNNQVYGLQIVYQQ